MNQMKEKGFNDFDKLLFRFIVYILGGSMFRLKGSILSMSFLDCNGALVPYSYEPWKDDNRGDASRRDRNNESLFYLILYNINLFCNVSRSFALFAFASHSLR